VLEVLVLLQRELPELLQRFLLSEVLEVKVFALLDGLVVLEDSLEHVSVPHSLV
jgi:hypothetical protein